MTIAYLGVKPGMKNYSGTSERVSYDEMVEAGKEFEAGILSVTVLLGLAGRTPKAVEQMT